LNPKKILVIRLSSIGDVLLTTPLLRLLRKNFPDAFIGFVIKKQYLDLVRENPYIDQVYSLDTSEGFKALKAMKAMIKSEQFDLIIDIHKNFRSLFLRSFSSARIVSYPKFTFKRFLLVKFRINLYREIIPVYKRYLLSVKAFGIQDDGHGLEFYLDKSERSLIASLLSEKGYTPGKPVICMAPGASYETKRWPAEYYAQVAQNFIKSQNAQIILLGDSRDRLITATIQKAVKNDLIDLSGQLTLMETACALDHADLVITNDTGLMHLATALQKKTLAIFGPTTKELGFFPTGHFAQVIENSNLNCRPCSYMGSRKCPKGHFRCMKEIEPEIVYKAALSLLNQN